MKRLDSWKEVAAYLGRSVRSVQRWEREGLPVHRHVHQSLGSIYAISDEIDDWLRRRSISPAQPVARDHGLFRLIAHHRAQRTRAGLLKSVHYAEQAVAAEPENAQAHASLALSLTVLMANGGGQDQQVERARSAAERARALDPRCADAHLAYGMIKVGHDFDWLGGVTALEQTIRLRPGDAHARQMLAFAWLALDERQRALDLAREAYELAPLVPISGAHLGWIQFVLRNFDAALRTLERATNLDSLFWRGWMYLGCCYLECGRIAEAIGAVRTVLRIEGFPPAWSMYAECRSLMGDAKGASRILDRLSRSARHTSSYWMGRAYARLGDRQRALLWLDRAASRRDGYLMYLSHDPGFDSLRGERDFLRIQRSIGLADPAAGRVKTERGAPPRQSCDPVERSGG